MLLQTVFGLSLVVSVSLDSHAPLVSDPAAELQLPIRQKHTALLPLVRRATECIARQVLDDARYSETLGPGDLSDLIVDALAGCERSLRAMVDSHDRMFGSGSGEAFMLGPYLDVLPAAVVKQVKGKPPER